MSSAQPSMEELLKTLPSNATMRDIFDFCMKHKLHNLAQGMIELNPPEKLRNISARVCIEGNEVHQYRNRFGEPDYRESIVELLSKKFGCNVPKDAVLATAGVSGGIVSTLMLLKSEAAKSNRLPKIAILVPFYTYHNKQIQDILGVTPVYIPTNEDFTPNWDAITKELQNGLDLIMFTNPGNPQGNLWTKADLDKMVELTKAHNCMLLLDEIYCDLVWKGTFYSPIHEKLHDHVVVCRGFSKTLGCQSWRVGYVVASPTTAEKLMRIHDPLYISVPFLQHGIAEYIKSDYEDFLNHVQQVSDLMQSNWRLLSRTMQKTLGWQPLEPSGSMYGLFKHGQKSDRDAVLQGLYNGVGVAPGNIFWNGTPDNTTYVRIHVGISAEKAQQIADTLEKNYQERQKQ